MILRFQTIVQAPTAEPSSTNSSSTDPRRLSAEENLLQYVNAMDASFREKAWANERLGWLFTPQSILFTAFGLTFAHKDTHELRYILSTLGIALSFIVLLAIFSAARMHQFWTKRMNASAKAYHESIGLEEGDAILAFGTAPFFWPSWLTRWMMPVLPLIFICAWAFMIRYI